jgi:hypothetical protein
MRKVFSSIEVSETVLVRDALLNHGIEAIIQNEYSGRSATPEFRPPADVWIVRDADFDSAGAVITETLSTIDSKVEGAPWVCASCKSENPASFELCWSCGGERSAGGAA